MNVIEKALDMASNLSLMDDTDHAPFWTDREHLVIMLQQKGHPNPHNNVCKSNSNCTISKFMIIGKNKKIAGSHSFSICYKQEQR